MDISDIILVSSRRIIIDYIWGMFVREEADIMHWADVVAKALLEKGNVHLISTGITPSGTLHVGTLREAITAEAVRKSLAEQDADVRMIYLVDSWNP